MAVVVAVVVVVVVGVESMLICVLTVRTPALAAVSTSNYRVPCLRGYSRGSNFTSCFLRASRKKFAVILLSLA